MAESSNADQLEVYRKLAQNWKLIADARRAEMEKIRTEAARQLSKQDVEWKTRIEALRESSASARQPEPDTATYKRVQDLTRELERIKRGFAYKVFFFLRSPRKALKEFSRQRKERRKAALAKLH